MKYSPRTSCLSACLKGLQACQERALHGLSSAITRCRENPTLMSKLTSISRASRHSAYLKSMSRITMQGFTHTATIWTLLPPPSKFKMLSPKNMRSYVHRQYQSFLPRSSPCKKSVPSQSDFLFLLFLTPFPSLFVFFICFSKSGFRISPSLPDKHP